MTRYLVVDDEPMVRTVVRRILRARGGLVAEAADGLDALEVFERSTFDLVITDISMPRMDGLELIQALQAQPRRIPIVAMTGGSGLPAQDYLKTALGLGATAVRAKPFRASELLEVISGILQPA